MSEAATRGVLWKKVFLKILQQLKEDICVIVRTSTPTPYLGDEGLGWLSHFSERLYRRDLG